MNHSMRVSAEIIESWIEAGGKTLKICVGELVDNAADAGARSITVDIERDTLVVEDNGTGFGGTVDEAVNKFLTYGGSRGRHGRLGRWGIGLKESAAWLASRLEILSSANGRDGVRIVADWDRMISRQNFELEAAQKTELRNIGTFICLSGVRTGKFNVPGKRQLKADLARTYAPGLRQGLLAIHFRDGPGLAEQLTAAPRPSLSHPREFVGFLKHREFLVFCGLLTERKYFHDFSGWHFCYGPRVLNRVSAKLNGFYGEVILQEKHKHDWHLDRHKMDFAEKEELVTHLSEFPEVQELFKKLDQACRTIELEQIQSRVTTLLGEVFAELQQQKRPGRPRTDKDHEPAGGQRVLNQAASTNPDAKGNVRRPPKPKDPARKLGRLQPLVRWVDWESSAPIGRCELDSRTAVVEVNKNHPWFAGALEDRPMLTIAMMLLAEAFTRFDGPQLTLNLQTPDETLKMVTLLSSLLATVQKQHPAESIQKTA